MSLITRCPACSTAFRVQSAQLAAHGGSVRCGQCGDVFNGVAALVDDGDDQGPGDTAAQAGAHASVTAPEADASEAKGPFLEQPANTGRGRWLWGLASVVAALAIGAQITYRYRAELAASNPEAGRALRALCQSFGCDVPLPRRPDLMSIDSTELQADSRREGLIVLNAVIRNRARFPQDYPALELTLTDDADRPVLRRVLSPRDYLEPPRREALLREGIAPGGETPLKLFLDTSRTRAVGYRLYLFYPL
ncbi:MAG: DUF3426 domain-containing protein [Burkholderiales bacterium]